MLPIKHLLGAYWKPSRFNLVVQASAEERSKNLLVRNSY